MRTVWIEEKGERKELWLACLHQEHKGLDVCIHDSLQLYAFCSPFLSSALGCHSPCWKHRPIHRGKAASLSHQKAPHLMISCMITAFFLHIGRLRALHLSNLQLCIFKSQCNEIVDNEWDKVDSEGEDKIVASSERNSRIKRSLSKHLQSEVNYMPWNPIISNHAKRTIFHAYSTPTQDSISKEGIQISWYDLLVFTVALAWNISD